MQVERIIVNFNLIFGLRNRLRGLKRFSCFSRKRTDLSKKKLHGVCTLTRVYQYAKEERFLFFEPCRTLVDICMELLLRFLATVTGQTSVDPTLMQLMLTFASCCLVPIIKKFCTHTPKKFCTYNHTNFSWKNLSWPRGERCNPWNKPHRELRALLFTTSALVFQRSLLTMSTLKMKPTGPTINRPYPKRPV